MKPFREALAQIKVGKAVTARDIARTVSSTNGMPKAKDLSRSLLALRYILH